MKKLLFLAVSMFALGARAESDLTILVNMRSCEPVMITGASPIAAPAVVYTQPVVYNEGVSYAGPVIYTAPVVYNTGVCQATTMLSLNACADNIYSYYPNHPCSYLYYPNMIRFGEIQAAREGYYFGLRR